MTFETSQSDEKEGRANLQRYYWYTVSGFTRFHLGILFQLRATKFLTAVVDDPSCVFDPYSPTLTKIVKKILSGLQGP